MRLRVKDCQYCGCEIGAGDRRCGACGRDLGPVRIETVAAIGDPAIAAAFPDPRPPGREDARFDWSLWATAEGPDGTVTIYTGAWQGAVPISIAMSSDSAHTLGRELIRLADAEDAKLAAADN